MAALVRMIREVEAALGSGIKQPSDGERRNLAGMRRGLFARMDIPAGTVFSTDNLIAQRPCGEINADRMELVLGRTAAEAVPAGRP
jgi:sialic acid synthase SpsE